MVRGLSTGASTIWFNEGDAGLRPGEKEATSPAEADVRAHLAAQHHPPRAARPGRRRCLLASRGRAQQVRLSVNVPWLPGRHRRRPSDALTRRAVGGAAALPDLPEPAVSSSTRTSSSSAAAPTSDLPIRDGNISRKHAAVDPQERRLLHQGSGVDQRHRLQRVASTNNGASKRAIYLLALRLPAALHLQALRVGRRKMRRPIEEAAWARRAPPARPRRGRFGGKGGAPTPLTTIDARIRVFSWAGPVTAARLAARGIVTAGSADASAARLRRFLAQVTPIAKLGEVADGTVVLVRVVLSGGCTSFRGAGCSTSSSTTTGRACARAGSGHTPSTAKAFVKGSPVALAGPCARLRTARRWCIRATSPPSPPPRRPAVWVAPALCRRRGRQATDAGVDPDVCVAALARPWDGGAGGDARAAWPADAGRVVPRAARPGRPGDSPTRRWRRHAGASRSRRCSSRRLPSCSGGRRRARRLLARPAVAGGAPGRVEALELRADRLAAARARRHRRGSRAPGGDAAPVAGRRR